MRSAGNVAAAMEILVRTAQAHRSWAWLSPGPGFELPPTTG